MNEHEAYLHRRAWDAIPWVVAGAASSDEVRCVDEHLPRCTECQAEWALQSRVHAGLDAGAPAAKRLPDARASWRKLAARLDVAESSDPALAAAVAAAPAAAHGGDPAQQALHTLARVVRPRNAANQAAPRPVAPPRWTRWLVAAVVVQAVALGACGLALLGRDGDAEYRTLSQPLTAPATPAAARLRLVPAPGLDFAALRQLLAQTRLVAVEVGPDGSSLGLAPADGDPRTAAAALPVLRASPLVMLAEPLAGER
jgi:hypothetical protein